MKAQNENFFYSFFKFWVSTVSLVTIVLASYVYALPVIEERFGTRVDYFSPLRETRGKSNIDRGLRSSKIRVQFDYPKDIVSEIVYKDIKLISTSKRAFSSEEIKLVEHVIDDLPQKLFDYRPWAIISVDFSQSSILQNNPDGVAFSSGPYMYVGDITFDKQNGFDTGTYRGMNRIIAHEFTHAAQFFETTKFPENFNGSYLESSALLESWTQATGWQQYGSAWILNANGATTEYGKTSPVEDMADSVGSMVIGDEFSISSERVSWILNWLGISKESLFQGTLPASANLKQRRVEDNDYILLNKYSDKTAISQDIMNFQNTSQIGKREFAAFYANELKQRGWSGTIVSYTTGSFTLETKESLKYKLNFEIDNNPLRVVTVVMSVY